MSTQTQAPAGLRSSLANAAWLVEERVVWGSADLLRGIADAIKWPFERIGWGIEQGVLWPLQDRFGPAWDRPVRVAGIALLSAAAIGAGVAGLLWAAPDHGDSTTKLSAIPATAPPVISKVPAKTAPPAQTLHGSPPVFATPPSAGGDKAPAATESEAAKPAVTTPSSTPKAAPGENAKPVENPAAVVIAHRFADAFVLFETGVGNDKVRSIFHDTATPALARSLLRRPPRLPANVKVPRAKVLNVVLGPSHNGVYTISVSLLRVGRTSELRLDMQKDKTGNWQVTNVLG
jgi:hypothetical protein